MLTGDKVGTAKNIAAACNILPASVDPLEITEDAVPPLIKAAQSGSTSNCGT